MTELGYLYATSEKLDGDAEIISSFLGGELIVQSADCFEFFKQVKCNQCKSLMIFLCQIHAPIDNFPMERIIYIFICLKKSCQKKMKNWRVFRYMYPSENQTDTAPLTDWKNTLDQPTSGDDDDDWGDVDVTVNEQKSIEPIIYFNSSGSPFERFYFDFQSQNLMPVSNPSKELIDKIQDPVSREIAIKHMNKISHSDEFQGSSSNINDWIKIYKLESSIYEIEDDDYMGDSGYSQLETYFESNGSSTRESIRYSYKGLPYFLNGPDESMVPLMKCQVCGQLRIFEFQLFSVINNYLKLKTPNVKNLLDEVSDDEDLKIPGSSLDWMLKFTTALVFTCESNCLPPNGMVIEELCIVENWKNTR